MAKLKFFYGCMGSAKTMRLLTTAYNFEEKCIRFLALKPKIDTRDGENKIHSRSGLERECIMVNKDENIYDRIHFMNMCMSADHLLFKFVLVDECQFLTSKQVDELAKLVDFDNINVFCYGLRTDFTSHLFKGSKRLFEIADDFEEVPSMCECGRKTSINARFNSDGEIIRDGEQIMIGGNESYKAICRRCNSIK